MFFFSPAPRRRSSRFTPSIDALGDRIAPGGIGQIPLPSGDASDASPIDPPGSEICPGTIEAMVEPEYKTY